MKKIQPEEILPLPEFEKGREAFRAQIIALKSRRRVFVGPFVSLVFENRDTVRWQIQEMVRAEHMTDEGKVLAEIETYNELIPDPGELSATLLIEIGDIEELRAWLPRLVNIEHAVFLRVGDWVVHGVAEAGRSEEDRTSTVHYVQFPLPPEAQRRFTEAPVELAIEHPHYTFRTSLSRETVEALAEDLRP